MLRDIIPSLLHSPPNTVLHWESKDFIIFKKVF